MDLNTEQIQLKFTKMQLKKVQMFWLLMIYLQQAELQKLLVILIKKVGGNLVGAAFLIELNALNGREKLNDCGKIISMLQY